MYIDKISKIISCAIDNVDYYSFLPKNASLDEFPIITRQHLQTEMLKFVNLKYKNNEQLMVKTSSGSSGRPISIYWSKDNYLSSMHTLWKYRRIYYNIFPYTKCLDFTLNTTSDSWFMICKSGISVSRKIINDVSKIEELLALMEKYCIEWLYIQPHVALILSRTIVNNNLSTPKSIRYIEFVGEILTPSTRNFVESVFKCITANMYGSEEMNGIAYECPYHTMHIISDNVYAETDNNLEGEIILTNLKNEAMPLIKYQLGDIVALSRNNKCMCGIYGDTLSLIEGRNYEKINLVDNRIISPYILIDIIENINKIIENQILEYKLVVSQKYGSKKLYIVPKNKKCIQKHINMIYKILIDENVIINTNELIIAEMIPSQKKYSVIEVM